MSLALKPLAASATVKAAIKSEVIRLLDEAFPQQKISLRTLFRDEQRKITDIILNESLNSAAAAYKTIYENQGAMMRFLDGLNIPIPPPFKSAAEIALNSQLHQAVNRPEIDADTISSYLKEAASSHIAVDTTTLEYAIRQRVEKEAEDFAANPDNFEIAERLRKLLDFALALPFQVIIWQAQNVCYGPIIRATGEYRDAAEAGDPAAQRWMNELAILRDKLRIQVA